MPRFARREGDCHHEARVRVAGASAFTIVELMVVIAVITLLIAMTLPSLNKAKERAVLAKDISNVRQVMIASSSYALDSSGFYPHRTVGSYMPHQVKGTGYDFNKTFFPKYLQGRENAFCLGRLKEVRDPNIYTQYKDQYVTMQYLNYNILNAGLLAPKVDLARDSAVGKHTLWSCLTTLKDSNNWLGHDAEETPVPPTGQCAAKIDGSAAWHGMSDMEMGIFVVSHQFWRAKP
ncbi:MAG: type II secretion system protein [Phycisphaeraceae bacterium]